jgi:hypothetical protein
LLVSQIAVIDTDPCAIVRIGPMAAGTTAPGVMVLRAGDVIDIQNVEGSGMVLDALNGGGYIAEPLTPWNPGTEFITVNGTPDYFWDGSVWTLGG